MITQIRIFISHKFVFAALGIALGLNAITSLLARVQSDAPLVTRYTILSGIEEVGDPSSFSYLPLLALLLFTINIILSFVFFHRERTLSLTFLSSGIICEIIFLFGVLSLRAVNGY
ncbi:MAG: hypothetical protein HYV65_02650 [Candidatus Spechtbacteria bacterium]|nr:hypothetical protein [Candidatus Spechtbacteria bacterium]